MNKRRKVLLIGWDAADWKVARPLLERGEMPYLAKLVAGGSSGNIGTLDPPLSPMLWTSIATGKRPTKHGIHGFTEPSPDGQTVRPISVLSRTTKAVWNILNQNQFRPCVAGWWPSHPAEPINGVIVSNHFHQAGDGPQPRPLLPRTVHPREWSERLEGLRVSPMELPGEVIQSFVPDYLRVDQDKDKRLHALGKIVAETMSMHAAATEILEHAAWDFAAVYYDAIDHFCHGFMQFHPPRLPWVAEESFELYRHVVANAYRYHDVMLGRLLQLAGSGTTVILVSDHGFHPDGLRPGYIPAEAAGPAVEHRAFGMIVLAGPGISKAETIYGSSLLDIAPTVLHLFGLAVGQDMDGKVLVTALERPGKIEFIPTWDVVEGDAGTHPAGEQLDAAESVEVMKQMVALGYVAPPGEDAAKNVAACLDEHRYNLARAYDDAGRPDQSVPLYQTLHSADRGDQRYAQRLVDALLETGDRAGARGVLDAFDELCETNGPQSKVELNHRRQSKPDGALNGLRDDADQREVFERRKLAERASGFPLLRLALRVRLDLADGRPEEARRGIVLLAERFGDDDDVPALLLAGACAQLDDDEAALAWIDRALKRDRDDWQALALAARIYLRKRQFAAAIDAAAASLSLIYFQPYIHFVLGRAMAARGEYEDAERAFRVAVKQRPGLLAAHEALARLCKKQGQHGEAVFYQNRAAELRQRAKQRGKDAPATAPAAGPETAPLPARDGLEPAQPEHDVVVVAGLPRSGTSMLMQLLAAGGVAPLTDGLREADSDNPRGYFEFGPASNLAQDASWLPHARGKAVKLALPLVMQLPPGEPYRVIVIERHPREVIASQRAMLQRLGRADEGAALDDDTLAAAYHRQRERLRLWLERRSEVAVLPLCFDAVLSDPQGTVARVAAFLGRGLDVAAAARTVDPALRRQRASAVWGRPRCAKQHNFYAIRHLTKIRFLATIRMFPVHGLGSFQGGSLIMCNNRTRSYLGRLIAVGAVWLLCARPAQAQNQTFYWDPSGANNSASDGSGLWGATDIAWIELPYNNLAVSWTNVPLNQNNAGNNAIFGSGTGDTNPYTVTQDGFVYVNNITFADQNYTIAADPGGNSLLLGNYNGVGTPGTPGITANVSATIAAPITLGAPQQHWTIAAGQVLTISGPIAGQYGLTAAGSGTLALNSPNTFTGLVSVTGGTLAVGDPLALQYSTLDVESENGVVFNVPTATVGGLQGLSDMSLGSSTLTVGNNGASTTYSGGISGTGALIWNGSGSLTLAGSNTYSGNTTISGGTLMVIGTLSSAKVCVGPNTLAGSALITGNVSVAGGVINFSAGSIGGTLAAAGCDWQGTGTVAGLVTCSSNVFTIDSFASLTASSGVNLSGGSLVVNGTLAGDVLVAAGTILAGAGSITSGTSTVLSGGTVQPGYGPTGAGSLGLNGASFASGSAINITNAANYMSTPAITAATVSTTGTVNVYAAAVPAGTGAIELLSYSGTVGGSGAAAFVLKSPVDNALASYSLSNSGGVLDLVYSSNSIYWSGLGNGSWDSSSANNWKLSSNDAPATYLDGANVIFDDRAGPGSAITVSIGANVSPASVIFNNSTASYTLSSSGGFGIVGNTAVTVSGGGVVTIANSNGYTGGTTLSAGQMNINNNSALGSGNFIIAGGVIDSTVSGVTLANNPQFWTGDFTFNGSNNLNLGAGAVMLSGFRNVTLNANTLTIGGAVTNSNGLSLAGAGSAVFSGPISGAGGLLVNGPGAITLSASNGYTGGATLAGGVLNINNNYALGTGTFTITGGSIDGTTTGVTLAGVPQAWNGNFAFLGSNNLNLGTGAVTLGGNYQLTVSANTLTIGNPVSNNGNTLTIAGAGYTNQTGSISGGGGVVFSGPGVLNVTGSNAFTGNLNITGGTLSEGATAQFYDSSPSASTVVTVGPGAVLSFSGNDPFRVLGSGNYVGGFYNLSDTASNLVLNNGTILYTSPAGNAPANIGVNGYSVRNFTTMGSSGGTIDVTHAGVTWTLDVYRAGKTGTASPTIDTIQNNSGLTLTGPGNLVIRKAITGAGGVTMNGSGTLQIGPAMANLAASESDSYTGNTTINSGTLKLQPQVMNTYNFGSLTAIPYGSGFGNVYLNSGATLDLQGRNTPINGLSDGPSGGGTVTSGTTGAIALTVGDNDQTSTFSGVIQNGSGTLALTKTGAGMLTLAGTNTYTGTTTIAGGTLQIGSAGELGSGNYAAAISDSSVIAFNTSVNQMLSGEISGSGELVQSGPGTLTLTGTNTYGGGTTVAGGTLVVDSSISLANGSSLIVGDAAAFGPIQAAGAAAAAPMAAPPAAAVPEPGAFALLLAALASGVIHRRPTTRRK